MVLNGNKSGKSTRGSIRFDSVACSAWEFDGISQGSQILNLFVDAHPAAEVKVSSAAWQPKKTLKSKKQSRAVA